MTALEVMKKLHQEFTENLRRFSFRAVVPLLVFLGTCVFYFVLTSYLHGTTVIGANIAQLLVDLSKLLRSPFALVLVAALVVIVALFLRYYATPGGRLRVDGILLKIPLFGELIQKVATAQFCRTFSSLTRAGVPILLALEIGQDTAGNSVISKAIMESRNDVQDGVPLSVGLSRKNVFPDLAMSMLGIGEETGRLDHMFERVANVYEAETRTTIRRLTAIFEPAVILVMGSPN